MSAMAETSAMARRPSAPNTPPPKKAPPVNQTPLTHKTATQPFSMGATNKAKSIYRQIALETKGHYFVGMKPEKFLEEFLPWNESTLDAYKRRVPSKRRQDTLRSVPPQPKGVEKDMYKPFVEALDQWITRSALKHTNIPNPQTLRFLNTQHPDTSCESLNVDVSTYWTDDLPKSTDFSSQQTHEEFKPDIGYDPFKCDSDESNVKGKETLYHEEDAEDEDDSDEEEGEDEDNDNDGNYDDEGQEEEGQEDTTNGELGATNRQADAQDRQPNTTNGPTEATSGQVDLGDDYGYAGNDLTPDILHEVQPLEDQPVEEHVEMRDAANIPQSSASSGVETDTVDGIETRGQIAAYAGLALSMAFRNHFFSMLILGPYARFIRWDRRGAVVTSRFDFTQRPKLIFGFYLRYGQLTLRQRGFDPTVKLWKDKLPKAVKDAFGLYYQQNWYGGGKFPRRDAPPPPPNRFYRIEITDQVLERTEAFFIPAPRYTRSCLFPFCRATRRCLACPEKNIERQDELKEESKDTELKNIKSKNKTTERLMMCFLKDSWLEESLRTAPEADIYRLLKREGVQHVASMRLGGDVEGLVTETQNWFSELGHDSHHRRLGKMVCHRLILDTVARDLSTFSWCKVLLSCIADAVEGAQQAYKAGILHRDLSAGNIMITKDRITKQWRGILIDWDMCLLWQNHDGEARTGRTGTWAFISAKILLTPHPVAHTLWDDIESAFWVLVYQALRNLRHDLRPHALYSRMQLIFAHHIKEEDGSVTGGEEKKKTILCCANQASHEDIAQFEVDKLNELLDELGEVFNYRYYNTRPRKGDPSRPSLDDPDDKWFSDCLRGAAMVMEPLCITPTGLKSPTNDSKPPADPKDWEPASVRDVKIDLDPMPWTANPEESTRVQALQHDSVTSSVIHHIDGSSLKKRTFISTPADEDEPSHKKQRK